MANKIHFNLFIFSLHLLWTLSYISSILHSIHHMAVLTTFRLLASWRGCNNTFVRVQQATYHLPSPLPNMLKWCLSVHTCSLVQSGTTRSSKSQSALQVTVPLMATHISVPVKRWLCPSMINIMTTIHEV